MMTGDWLRAPLKFTCCNPGVLFSHIPQNMSLGLFVLGFPSPVHRLGVVISMLTQVQCYVDPTERLDPTSLHNNCKIGCTPSSPEQHVWVEFWNAQTAKDNDGQLLIITAMFSGLSLADWQIRRETAGWLFCLCDWNSDVLHCVPSLRGPLPFSVS